MFDTIPHSLGQLEVALVAIFRPSLLRLVKRVLYIPRAALVEQQHWYAQELQQQRTHGGKGKHSQLSASG